MLVHLGLVQVLVEVRRVVVLVRNPNPDELGYWGRKDLSSLGIIFLEDFLFFNSLYMIVHVVFCYCLSLQSNYATSEFDQNSPYFAVCKTMYTKT